MPDAASDLVPVPESVNVPMFVTPPAPAIVPPVHWNMSPGRLNVAPVPTFSTPPDSSTVPVPEPV